MSDDDPIDANERLFLVSEATIREADDFLKSVIRDHARWRQLVRTTIDHEAMRHSGKRRDGFLDRWRGLIDATEDVAGRQENTAQLVGAALRGNPVPRNEAELEALRWRFVGPPDPESTH